MKINEVKIEFIDEESRFVLKRIVTDEGDFFNRKLSVCNSIYSCERKRKTYGKPSFGFKFQTHHLMWDSKEEEWEFKGLKKAKQHADESNRIFMPYKQRNESQWESLKWEESRDDFFELLGKSNIVPYPIPLFATLEEWKEKKKQAEKKLDEGQILMPIFSSKHNVKNFPEIIKYELSNSMMFGLCCGEFSSIIEITNLSILKSLNSNLKVGDNCALITFFDYPRILRNHSYVAGSFGCCCFAGDIFSEKAYFPARMSPPSIEKMMDKKPEEYWLYDPKQKKFNKSVPQADWYGQDLTRTSMKNISVNEGLNGYQVVKVISHILQQRDLDFINELLIAKQPIVKSIKNFAGWDVFYSNSVENQSIQKSLNL